MVCVGLSGWNDAIQTRQYKQEVPLTQSQFLNFWIQNKIDFSLILFRDYTSKDKAASGGKMLKRVVDALEERGIVTDTISRGDTKFMGVAMAKEHKHFRRIDIRILPADQGTDSIRNFFA